MFNLRLEMFLPCLCFVLMYIAINFISRALANSIYINILLSKAKLRHWYICILIESVGQSKLFKRLKSNNHWLLTLLLLVINWGSILEYHLLSKQYAFYKLLDGVVWLFLSMCNLESWVLSKDIFWPI